ncbi:MAG: ATPase, T2SS/T4P/T4SS family [Burkholderiales bacterium]|nr:ATPase, T2SS/T4P/T4SS family [Burkholderiales bacterium]
MEYSGVLTAKGAKYELSQDLRAKLVLLGDGSILINENYKNDRQVLSKVAYFKNIVTDEGEFFVPRDRVKYVTQEEVSSYYDDSSRVAAMQDANQIQKTVMEIISIAFSEKVTDIHIELRAPSTFIQFRKLGSLYVYQQLTFEDGVSLCTALYNSMTLSSGTSYNPRTQQDANMRHDFLPTGLAGVRVATGPTQGGNCFMVLRLLPLGQNIEFSTLGYSKAQMEALEYCNSTHSGGITLVCGPTGSGKSTTLQLLAKQNLLKAKGEINFLTIEDPVEYPIVVDDEVDQVILDPITNKYITKRIKVTYSARQIAIASTDDAELKKRRYRETVVAAMRQDPDIIMIGEIRDAATADAAITASNTGHPVISTVHARNAQMIIDRLIMVGADRNLLLSPDMITGLFAQHLVPEICPKCKLKLKNNLDRVNDSLKQRLEETFKEHGGLDGIYVRNISNGSSGCGYYDEKTDRRCYNGNIGRTVVAEFILPDEQYLQYMRDNKMYDAYRYWIEKLNGYTMMAHGLAKVKNGVVDPESLESKLKLVTYQDNLGVAIEDVAGALNA